MKMKELFVVKYFVILLWFSVSFVIALLIFGKGLLLHRDILPNKANCTDEILTNCYNIKKQNIIEKYMPTHRNEQFCFPSNFKVILVIIDALRYDFAEYNYHINASSSLPYMNKLTVIRDLLQNNSNNSRLFKFISDPPTTTMQRIVGLTTGSLPTFVDIGSNFASSEIDEDNIIDLLNKRGKNSVFMGDDTWCKLYPNRFIRSFPFDSFNVWDLDTVDSGIQKHIYSEIHKNDWNLLIAHFLGVDHCGHRYGPHHSEMERKLTEMNYVLKRIVKEIQHKQNVLLFVIGDHGMTSTGDHGGDTQNEVTTALFTYSPFYDFYSEFLKSPKIVSQVDLTPTLSSILGSPIPFSNVGSVILDCIPVSLLNSVSNVAFILWRNVEQITNYVEEYSSKNSQFKTTKRFDITLRSYAHLQKIWMNVDSDNIFHFIGEYEIYMKKVLNMCQEVWIQFDKLSISAGLSFMLFSSIMCCCIINGLTLHNFQRYISGRFFVILNLNIFSSPVIIILCSSLFSANCELISYILIETSLILLMIWLCKQLFPEMTFSIVSKQCMSDLFIFFQCFFLFIGLFTNSFVIEESFVSMFFFLSSLWVIVIFRFKHFKYFEINHILDYFDPVSLIILSFGVRIARNFVKCREEQVRCKDAINVKYETIICFSAVILIVLHISSWQKTISINSVVLKFLPKLCLVLISLYWICESFFEDYRYTNKIPLVLLMTCFCFFCYLFCTPNVTSDIISIRKKKASINITQKENHLQFIFYSSFTKVTIFLCILSCTLLGQIYAIPAILMFTCLRCLAEFLNKSEINSSLGKNNYDVRWSYIILWGMSSIYWFYVTGHYASFSGIQWNAAFLMRKDIGNNMLLPGILVTLNTFISYTVHAILLPLLLISKLTSSYFQLLICKPPETIDQNEIVTYVNECKMFYHGSFALILKYICFFSIRLSIVMLSSTVLSRHLMMWKVFAPKFIFEGMAFIAITIPSSFIAFLFLFRIEKQIRKIMKISIL